MEPTDLAEEQAHLDLAHDELTRMRTRAERLLTTMKGSDPDLEWALNRRVRALAHSPRALCFGRIDGVDGTSWHIGRRHVEDEMGDPVVVEWRAPVALPFYRAGWSEPMGLARRRQFVVEDRTLLSIGDDTFGARGTGATEVGATEVGATEVGATEVGRTEVGGTPVGGGDDTEGGSAPLLRGREALLVELERARSGEMLDIVATIQPEQDRIIRADAPGILAVQGGPGSGKTAVGLHRAAFLLYGDDAMARAGVLVVGPNRTFLRYIAQVLPTLGESAVVQTTLVDLVPEIAGTSGPGPETDPEVERLKGDGRMAGVLARALAARRRPDDTDLEVGLGVRRLVVPAAEVDLAVGRVAASGVPYAAGRDILRDHLVSLVARRYGEVAGLPAESEDFDRTLRRSEGIREALDRRWPTVAPVALVADLWSKPAVLAAAADGALGPAEQALLRRRRGRAWTTADAPLVDEARHLITGQTRTYAHAIVDEAQDLSPLQLRMLARRCPSGSMTLLGDLAQAVGVWGLRDWRAVGEWLPAPDGIEVVELRYGYRSPGQVLELAGRLLPAAAPDVTPTEAVRPGRHAPVQLLVEGTEVPAAVTVEVARLAREWSTVGVVAPVVLIDRLVSVLAGDPALDVGRAAVDGLGHAVTVMTPEAAKGLEFDAVVVVEANDIAAERSDRAAGLRLLYVALTRPTQHLSVIGSTAVPELAAA